MDYLKGLLPAGAAAGGGSGQQTAPQSGLLGDWQSYQATQDVEAGGGAASTSQQLNKTVTELGTSITTFFRSGYTTVSDGVSGLQAPSLERCVCCVVLVCARSCTHKNAASSGEHALRRRRRRDGATADGGCCTHTRTHRSNQTTPSQTTTTKQNYKACRAASS